MPTEWYYQSEAQAVGPLSPKQLLEKVREGVVTEQTLIRKDDSNWVQACQVNGLIEAAHKDRLFDCPYCGSAIARPPTTCRHCTRWIDYTDNYRDPTPDRKPETGRSPKVVRRVTGWVRSLMDDEED